MGNQFTDATKKIQDWTAVYNRLDTLPNRKDWYFKPTYTNHDTCAFVFSHATADINARYSSINMLSNVLSQAGIKNSLVSRDGILSDILIAPEQADLARKIFAKYEAGHDNTSKKYDSHLGQEWMNQHQK